MGVAFSGGGHGQVGMGEHGRGMRCSPVVSLRRSSKMVVTGVAASSAGSAVQDLEYLRAMVTGNCGVFLPGPFAEHHR